MDFILEFLQINMTEIQTFDIQTLNSEYGPDYSGVSLIMPNILIISLLIIISNIPLNSF